MAVLFIKTAPPTIYLGDSGELASAAVTLGIGHPPGYPLFTMAGKLFTVFLPGDVGYRLNLAASFYAVIVLILFYCFLSSLLSFAGRRNNTAALLAAFCFAVSPVFWFNAMTAKGGIYMLAYVFSFAAAFSAVKFLQRRDSRFFYLGMFAAGFMISCHYTTALLSVLCCAVLLGSLPRGNSGRALRGAAFFAISFLTPFLYLFIRAGSADITWAGLDSEGTVLGHIFRDVYSSDGGPPFSGTALVFKFKEYFLSYASGLSFMALFGAAGWFVLFRAGRRLFAAVFGFFFIQAAALFIMTGNSPTPLAVYVNRPFYMLNDAAVLTAAAFAVSALSFESVKRFRTGRMLVYMLFIPVLFMASAGFRENNHSRSFLAYDHGLNILKTAGNGNVVFLRADVDAFSVHYLKKVKKLWEGVRAYDKSGNVLDTAVYKNIRRKDGWMTRADADKIEAAIREQNPGKTFYIGRFMPAGEGVQTASYGMLYEAGGAGSSGSGLMSMVSLRDYFINPNADYFHRQLMASYFVKKAEQAVRAGDRAGFEFYKNRALETGFDSAPVKKSVASVYFHDAADIDSALKYLEEGAHMDPYDFAALGLIMNIYAERRDRERFLYWLRFYADREWDRGKREAARRELN
mgnify:CR=1 FL=1